MWLIVNLDTVFSVSLYLGAYSVIKSYRMEACVCDQSPVSESSAAVHLHQKERLLWDFLLVKWVFAGSENPIALLIFACLASWLQSFIVLRCHCRKKSHKSASCGA